MGRKSNYEHGMYQQLLEIMGRLDSGEREHKQEVSELKAEISKEGKMINPESIYDKEITELN